MGKATFPDGSTRDITPANKSVQLQDYVAQSRSIGGRSDIDVAGTSAAFDQLAGGPPPAYGYQPGGGSSFFAGLEELFGSPTSFARDAAGGNSDYVPTAPGGGSTIVAGLEELSQKPGQFFSDLRDVLPSGPTLWIAGGLAIVGILAAAYIAHKAL